MKKIIISTTIVFIFVFASCEKNQNESVFKLKNFTHGECKRNNSKSVKKEYVKYQFAAGNYLNISHFNTVFNCCPGNLTVNTQLNNGIIKIYEKEEKQDCKCICPYDFTYTLGPLDFGRYIVKVYKNNEKHTEFTIDFNADTDGVFVIK